MGRSAVRYSLAIGLGLALSGCGGSTDPGGTLTIGIAPSSVSFAAIQAAQIRAPTPCPSPAAAPGRLPASPSGQSSTPAAPRDG